MFRANREWAFHRHSLRRARELRTGDIGFVYLTKDGVLSPNCIAAVAEVAGPGHLDPAGFEAEFYPYRVPFKVIAEFHPEIAFPPLVPSIQFLRRKDRYGVFLQGKSAINLNKHDSRELLRSALAASSRRQREALMALSIHSSA